jgi:hypothetical protein
MPLCVYAKEQYRYPIRSPRFFKAHSIYDLNSLNALGPQHEYGIARRIEQIGEDMLTLDEGTVYQCLLRLQQKIRNGRA